MQKRFCMSRTTILKTQMASRRPVRIKDVAAAAGVSVTTVSDALNGKGRLPEGTRKRVRAKASALGYTPNLTARSLATGKTGVLALTISTDRNASFAAGQSDYFVELMSAASSTALECGYAMILSRSGTEGGSQRVAIDGAIVVDPVLDDPILADLTATHTPTVTIGRDATDRRDGYWVDNDHSAGTRKVLDHLAKAGARSIALISGPAIHSYTRDVRTAYKAWCRESDLPARVMTAKTSFTEAAGYEAAVSLFEDEDRPDAIYATLDRLAVGARLAAEARSLRVPEDLLVAAMSDSAANRTSRPQLTALHLNPADVGHRAAEMLVALVEGRLVGDHHCIVPTVLLRRGSTRR